MSTENANMEWSEVRGKIKQRWDKLLYSDLDGFKDNMNSISEKLQKSYGYSKDQADREYAEFKKSLESTVGPAETAKPN